MRRKCTITSILFNASLRRCLPRAASFNLLSRTSRICIPFIPNACVWWVLMVKSRLARELVPVKFRFSFMEDTAAATASERDSLCSRIFNLRYFLLAHVSAKLFSEIWRIAYMECFHGIPSPSWNVITGMYIVRKMIFEMIDFNFIAFLLQCNFYSQCIFFTYYL